MTLLMKYFNKIKYAVVGLGYVGLPLLLAISKKNYVTGFDINISRVRDLDRGIDTNNEYKKPELVNNKITFTNQIKDLENCNVIIITIPTPIFKNKKPNLIPLKNAFRNISNIIKKGTLLIVESTVYPGVTEDILSKIIEKNTNLRFNVDFFLGYSPERVNPGDKYHSINNINKIVAGSNSQITNLMHKIYSNIISAKVYKVKNIKTAEASKVIENVQRDLNIALINELSIIFKKDDISIYDVLDASSTKWNFHTYFPGLVGGHCIGVDPYYLTYWANQKGYKSNFILSGRKINEYMVKYTTDNILNLFRKNEIKIQNSSILVMGVAFKENCSDIRNSKALEIVSNIHKYTNKIRIYDPLIDKFVIQKELKDFKFINDIKKFRYDAIILLTPHKKIINLGYDRLFKLTKKKSLIIDIKNSLKDDRVDFIF